jgi:hypothetical protein
VRRWEIHIEHTESCGNVLSSYQIPINGTRPEDTGKYKISINNQQKEVVEIFTYSEPVPKITWEYGHGHGPEVWYNQDEQVDIRCNAQSGRPTPVISWQINENEKNNLSSSSIFNITNYYEHDNYPEHEYVWNWVSNLSFKINKEFLDYLKETQNVDINFDNGSITFNLDCKVEQRMFGYKEIVTKKIVVSHAVSCYQNRHEIVLLTTILYTTLLYFNEV